MFEYFLSTFSNFIIVNRYPNLHNYIYTPNQVEHLYISDESENKVFWFLTRLTRILLLIDQQYFYLNLMFPWKNRYKLLSESFFNVNKDGISNIILDTKKFSNLLFCLDENVSLNLPFSRIFQGIFILALLRISLW